MNIREATEKDFDAIWPIFSEIVSAGETYAYPAMQFNFVASSNEGVIRLWSKLSFKTAGRLPRAFNHPAQEYIDALVMYK